MKNVKSLERLLLDAQVREEIGTNFMNISTQLQVLFNITISQNEIELKNSGCEPSKINIK